ncbi:MAG: polyphosphate kinase 2 family protein [Candidatus Marinimicrobia bacterium]|nr:polyphosphate kinase 2 family protein [Candidatus Neomarinimicrobiota bacterium]
MDFLKRYRLPLKRKCRLEEWDANDSAGVKNREQAERQTAKNIAAMRALEYRLYAENRQALLIVLQGMDAAGKDGAIRHVMAALNPQSCKVTSFKQPSALELSHDFLWRIHRVAPATGEIGIFNRSHYEDVLVVRVHDLVPRGVWSRRYDQINRFEQHLAENGTRIIKCFLYIDKEEQKQRLLRRLEDPARHWKITEADARERERWDDYVAAYEEALSRCNTKAAPWFIVPANRKWYRNLVLSQIVRKTLTDMKPQLPKPVANLDQILIT